MRACPGALTCYRGDLHLLGVHAFWQWLAIAVSWSPSCRDSENIPTTKDTSKIECEAGTRNTFKNDVHLSLSLHTQIWHSDVSWVSTQNINYAGTDCEHVMFTKLTSASTNPLWMYVPRHIIWSFGVCTCIYGSRRSKHMTCALEWLWHLIRYVQVAWLLILILDPIRVRWAYMWQPFMSPAMIKYSLGKHWCGN